MFRIPPAAVDMMNQRQRRNGSIQPFNPFSVRSMPQEPQKNSGSWNCHCWPRSMCFGSVSWWCSWWLPINVGDIPLHPHWMPNLIKSAWFCWAIWARPGCRWLHPPVTTGLKATVKKCIETIGWSFIPIEWCDLLVNSVFLFVEHPISSRSNPAVWLQSPCWLLADQLPFVPRWIHMLAVQIRPFVAKKLAHLVI